jgi:hypothetical protein
VDHDQLPIIELNRDDLKWIPAGIIAKEHESQPAGIFVRAILQKAQATVFNDISGTLTGDPVLGRGAGPLQTTMAIPIVSSDNTIKGWLRHSPILVRGCLRNKTTACQSRAEIAPLSNPSKKEGRTFARPSCPTYLGSLPEIF